jgi:hypothetical protein
VRHRIQENARVRDPDPEPVALPAGTEDAFHEAVAQMLAELADGAAALRERIAAVEGENAKLRVALAEAQAKLAVASHSIERMTVDKTGPRGERGPPGADGREGRMGYRGPKGDRGEPAPRIARWVVNSSAYLIRPHLDNGETLPPILLRPLIEQAYADAMFSDDLHDAEDHAEARAASDAEMRKRVANGWSK